MSDIITLSDDDEPQQQQDEGISGIPRTFANDDFSKFSFDVGFSQPQPDPEPDFQEDYFFEHDIYVPYERSPILTPEPKPPPTPKSILRRSVSATCLNSGQSSRKPVSPPKFQVCSTSVDVGSDEDKDDDELELRALLSPAKKRKTKEKVEKVLNEFFGVYCLISRSDRPCYKNRCYIGYTVDPNRRIMQHNGGRMKGGAKKTDSRGPWDMVCVVHGFPNHVAALRFEWAWQNPNVSKVIKERQLKKERKETPFAYQLRIACNLMSSAPFNRYALTFRWLITSEELPFPSTCLPPNHVKKKYGKVTKDTSIVSAKPEDYEKLEECHICGKDIEKIWHFCRCLSTTCRGHFHTSCLAEHALKSSFSTSSTDNLKTQLFPLSGNCPTCSHTFLWGDVIREQRRILKISAKCENDELKSQAIRKTII